MLFFLLFIVLMPALTYADYRLYGKKMEETLAAQPDYDQNRENYDALLAKLMARQKKTDTLVCAVLCIVAFILGVIPLATATGAGAAARQSMGTGVLGGMLAATFITTFFIPVFFTWFVSKKIKTRR